MDDRPPLAERPKEFEPMWTTEAHRYVLLGGKSGRHSPLDVSGDEDMIMLIDDDELAAAVTDRMLQAGVPVRE